MASKRAKPVKLTDFYRNKSNNNLLETLCMLTWYRFLEKLEHILKNLAMKLANESMILESNRPRLEYSGDWFAEGSLGSCVQHRTTVGDQDSSKKVSNVLTLHLKNPAYPKYLLQWVELDWVSSHSSQMFTHRRVQDRAYGVNVGP
jgi:hypothetical protein